MNNNNIHGLPKELCMEIYNLLPTKDIAQLTLVDKATRSVAQEVLSARSELPKESFYKNLTPGERQYVKESKDTPPYTPTRTWARSGELLEAKLKPEYLVEYQKDPKLFDFNNTKHIYLFSLKENMEGECYKSAKQLLKNLEEIDRENARQA